MQRIKRVWHSAWLPLLSVVLTCLYPCAFLYTHNIEEAPFTSMFPFFGVFLLNAVIFFLVFLVILRRAAGAAFMADMAMLVVINFTMWLGALQSVAPWLNSVGLLAAFGVLLLLLLALLLWKKPNMKIPCGLVALAFGALTVIAFGTAGITTLLRGDGGQTYDAQAAYEPKTLAGEKPNVYFFLFDGYAGAENLKHYYDYDNEPFLGALEDKGFTVSRDSHNPESLSTVTIVPNLLNMNYVVKGSMSTSEKDAMLVMPNFFRTFADNGYQINLINHLNYIGSAGCNVLTHKQSRRTISDFLLKNSLYYQSDAVKAELNRYIQADYVATYTGPLFDAMDAERDCWKQVGDGPTLTMGYVQCPHAPTILDRSGQLVEGYERVGWQWDRHELYLGQLEFVSDFILELVDTIQSHDPDALIILMSDHGSRQANHYYDMKIWDKFDAPTENLFMQNTLNCVYYRGQHIPIEGQTGINSLRLTLNQVFGTDYEMIKPKYYTRGKFEK